MIKSLKTIKSFGVFDNFTKPTDFRDFKEKNIIYGWNYSGKTTLSRVFSSIENKVIHSDYLNAKFLLELNNGMVINESNINEISLYVRVFNVDFIEKNLSWDGTSFKPILLLGEDTIEAERKIEANEKLIERCRIGYKKKRALADGVLSEVSDLKTASAKQIKTNLHLVETFTATHLSKLISALPQDSESVVLDEDAVATHLRKALSTNNDKLQIVREVSISCDANHFVQRANLLLKQTPEFSSVIEYLRDNPNVAKWVESGLEINSEKDNCEFCGGEITETRLSSLKAHFSKDLVNYKEKLKLLINEGKQKNIKYWMLNPTMLYPEYRDKLSAIDDSISGAIKLYNAQLEKVVSKLEEKYDSPFKDSYLLQFDNSFELSIKSKTDELNAIIKQSNERTLNFDNEKIQSVGVLKKHFAASFKLDNNIEAKENRTKKLNFHKDKYQRVASKFIEANKTLEASISKAQKGREKLNEYICNFLGREEIQIEVVKNEDHERFKLLRDGHLAKNLSEGEKSAIAFSFFLTKLGEIKDLSTTVVYIDDPISSLDSNHIFQVNALIKDFFFKKEVNAQNNNEEWQITCGQIFISTHNFEFFSLLKELPLGAKKSSYFQAKRISNNRSTLVNLPKSIEHYSSEYHYLFSVIYKFYNSDDKEDIEVLLSIPNALRRFIELYTYSRIPSFSKETVDQRADQLFGGQESKRILKVLHHFSHLNNIERLARNSDLICDIENAVNDIMNHLKKDTLHFDALISSVQ